jgi:glycosyltransferase involved in cell wall biosynthesis
VTRVLQVLGRSAGGIARHVAQVTEALDGTAGLSVDIAGPVGLPIPMPKELIPVDIPDGPVKGHPGAIGTLARLMNSYDVVHAHGLRAGIDAGLAARRANKRSLLTVHNLVRAEIAGPKAVLYRRAEAAAVWATDRTFAVSQDIARHLQGTVKRRSDRIEVMYLGIGEAPEVTRSREEVRDSLGLGPSTSLVVAVARLAPQKSLTVLFDAVGSLDEDVMVAVIGEGPLRSDLERYVRGLGLEKSISFLGFRTDVADHIAAADAFCLSSIWEGVPLSAQEAILLGTPVVGTDVGGMRELISNKVSGRLVPPLAPEALADALREVLGDPHRAAVYASAALLSLTERFSTGRMLDRLKVAYEG